MKKILEQLSGSSSEKLITVEKLAKAKESIGEGMKKIAFSIQNTLRGFFSPENKGDIRKKAVGALIGLFGIFSKLKLPSLSPLAKIDQEKTVLKNKVNQTRERLSLKNKEAKQSLNKRNRKPQENKDILNLKPAERVLKMCAGKINTKERAAHCWDFCRRVMVAANCKTRIVFKTYNQYVGRDCGNLHAKPDYVKSVVEPGDHIFINNKNTLDRYGNHSCIFVEWIDKTNLIAKVGNCRGAGKSGEYSTVDFKKKPITFIAKPVSIGTKGRSIVHYRKTT